MKRSCAFNRFVVTLLLVLGEALLAACSPGPLPTPVLESVSPAQLPATAGDDLAFTLEAVLPQALDYGAREARVQADVTVLLGDVELGTGAMDANGQVVLPFLSQYAEGVYDVKARLADGREATLPGAFTVLPGVFPDGYTIDPISTQHVGDVFDITVRAQGPAASSFAGTVALSISKGRINPPSTGRFTAGVRQQRVRVRDLVNETVTLTVTDSAGHSGTSNPFLVTGP